MTDEFISVIGKGDKQRLIPIGTRALKLIENYREIPLLSFRDARILIVTQICKNQLNMEEKVKQMRKRHHKRQADIDYSY